MSVKANIVEDDETVVIGEYNWGVLVLLDNKAVKLSVVEGSIDRPVSLVKISFIVWVVGKTEVPLNAGDVESWKKVGGFDELLVKESVVVIKEFLVEKLVENGKAVEEISVLADDKIVELSVFSMLFSADIEWLSLAKLFELVIWELAKFDVVVSRLVVIFGFVKVAEVWSELAWILELVEAEDVEIAELDKALGVVIWVVVAKVELIKFQVDDEETDVLVFTEAVVEIVVEVGITVVVDGIVIWNVQNDELSILGEMGLQ